MNEPAARGLTEAVADELTAIKAVQRHVTNQALADAAGLSTRQVIRMMQGKADIGLRDLTAFAGVLDVPVSVILDGAYKRMP